MAIGLNDGGRGLNVAIINPDTKEVSRVGHFDTYAEGMTLATITSFYNKEKNLWYEFLGEISIHSVYINVINITMFW